MKKTYLLIPLIALVAFIAIYRGFQTGHETREAARQEEFRLEREAKLAAEVDARRKAIEDALVSQTERKKEREARAAAEKAAQEIRQTALNDRDKAFREQERTARQIERVKKEIASEEETLAKLDRTEKSAETERAFLQAYVKKAEANARSLEGVLTQFASAETAREAAAAQALRK